MPTALEDKYPEGEEEKALVLEARANLLPNLPLTSLLMPSLNRTSVIFGWLLAKCSDMAQAAKITDILEKEGKKS